MRKRFVQDLDCHIPAEPLIACAIYLAHSASAERRLNLMGIRARHYIPWRIW